MGNKWQDFSAEENAVLRRAYLSGANTAKFTLRGKEYKFDFANNTQTNVETNRQRDIRAPHRLKRPKEKQISAPGRTMMVMVPENAHPGDKIMVPHPANEHVGLQVVVPEGGLPGATLMVPVPPLPAEAMGGGSGLSKTVASSGSTAEPEPAAEPAAESRGDANPPRAKRRRCEK